MVFEMVSAYALLQHTTLPRGQVRSRPGVHMTAEQESYEQRRAVFLRSNKLTQEETGVFKSYIAWDRWAFLGTYILMPILYIANVQKLPVLKRYRIPLLVSVPITNLVLTAWVDRKSINKLAQLDSPFARHVKATILHDDSVVDPVDDVSSIAIGDESMPSPPPKGVGDQPAVREPPLRPAIFSRPPIVRREPAPAKAPPAPAPVPPPEPQDPFGTGAAEEQMVPWSATPSPGTPKPTKHTTWDEIRKRATEGTS